MQVYIDITLLPNAEAEPHFLLSKVFQKLHLALVENQDANGLSPVGITFPEFNEKEHTLGSKIRLFATDEKSMAHLNVQRWLNRFSDYVHITSIRPVPENITTYVRFSRIRTKTSKERLARRASRRHGISIDQALKERESFRPEYTKAPFIWMKSLSSDNQFRLFIAREEATEMGDPCFTTYGLAKNGALPNF